MDPSLLFKLFQQYVSFFKKKKFKCPCCGETFSQFLPGPNGRPNARCPECDSLERHRLIWLYLKESGIVLSSKKLKILHFAPEKCLSLNLKKIFGINYTSCDINPGVADVTADITMLPFPSDFFDFVICIHVLEHIVDDRKAVKEIFRVLKEGGSALIQSPMDIKREKTLEDFKIISPEGRKKLFGQEDHVRIYGKDYKERLEESGFAVDAVDFVAEKGSAYIKEYRLTPEELIYLCHKQF